jgi:hypothetical protein
LQKKIRGFRQTSHFRRCRRGRVSETSRRERIDPRAITAPWRGIWIAGSASGVPVGPAVVMAKIFCGRRFRSYVGGGRRLALACPAGRYQLSGIPGWFGVCVQHTLLAYQATVLISAIIARRMASGRVGQTSATLANSGSDETNGCPSGCPEFETCVFSRVFVAVVLGSNPSSPVFFAILIVPAYLVPRR